MKNTCSIKLLKNAFVGVGVRMSSGDGTLPFENIPMKGMIIKEYTQLGFKISHPNLPREAWVQFEQLPLTRLTIKNGVIEDEITFVENIVNHKMQLIRTMDTEYIDLLYDEKELEKKKDIIIPISAAEVGKVYVGAQCEEGNEMVYLGTWYTKSFSNERQYSYFRSRDEKPKFWMSKASAPRAFFAISKTTKIELTEKEEEALDKEACGMKMIAPGIMAGNADRWSSVGGWDGWKARYEKLKNDKLKELRENSEKRYKIMMYPITSKRIKQLIKVNKEDDTFKDEALNKEILFSYINKFYLKGYPLTAPGFAVMNKSYEEFGVNFMTKDKENIDQVAREFIEKNYNVKLEDKFYEERY
jgi:hypothetical protein